MSRTLMPVLVCDGCGAPITSDFYIRIRPENQKVLQRDITLSEERDFCSEACYTWWKAEYPAEKLWGPAWEDRHWWREQIKPEQHTPVRTAHEEMPIIDAHAHFEDPEPLK